MHIDQSYLKVILIGHISEQNNHIDIVKVTIGDSLAVRDSLKIASEKTGSAWN